MSTFPKNSRFVLKTLALLGTVAPVSPVFAQNLNQPLYQGAQPQLVQGVQDGVANGQPVIRHVYLAAPDVIGVVVDAQQLWAGATTPYVAQPGDEIKRTGPQPYGKEGKVFHWNRLLFRQGVQIGNLVGMNEDFYTPSFKLEGEPLNAAWAGNAANYLISSGDDLAFRGGQRPLGVFRKSNPQMWEWTDKGKEEGSVRHEIFLRLPRALTPGRRYTLSFAARGQLTTPISFVFNDAQLRTEAIQVNQNGYHPRQVEKVARMFQWLGDGGGVDFSGLRNFQLVDDKSGKVAFNGEVRLLAAGNPARKMAPERTADPDNDLPAPLYQLDFSAFNTPGTYRVVVPGLGTSFPFAINENVWEIATRNAATGFYNQRSGIDLVAPYTRRPMKRTMHPADGFRVHKTDPAIFYDTTLFPPNSGASGFKRIQASILEDQLEPNAWGGWHDAADYDRSILGQGHLRAVHAMLDLYEANPAYFERLKLNLPENTNAIPDIIDEALWCTDLFLRIQQPDGGVPSAIESIEHPSEPGWLVKQPTATTPPTPQTCWLYAAAAAQTSIVLEKYDAARAKTYRDSAFKAMDWAAKNTQIPNIYGSAAQHENWAHFNMFRLTGEQKWHDEFKRTLTALYPDGNLSRANFGSFTAVASYALMPTEKADPALQKRCRDTLLRVADAKVAAISKLDYGVRSERYNWDERLGQSWELIAANRLTGDRKYVNAMDRQAQFALGLNPSNTSYITGLGSREVVPFDFSARYTGGPYPDGITTQGPGPRNIWRGTRTDEKLSKAGIYPAWENWPWAESNFGMREPPMNEHVVGGNMSNVLQTRAFLAQAMSANGN